MENVSGQVFYNCFNQAMSLPWGQFFFKKVHNFPHVSGAFPGGVLVANSSGKPMIRLLLN